MNCKIVNVGLDSTTLIIPIEHFNLTSLINIDVFDKNKEFGYFDKDSGEFIPENKEWKKDKGTISNKENGISTRFTIQDINWLAGNEARVKSKFQTQNSMRRFVRVLINSKVLKEEYLKGITKHNLIDAYNYFINVFGKYFHISYEDFKEHSILLDTDIKFDIEFDKSDFLNEKEFNIFSDNLFSNIAKYENPYNPNYQKNRTKKDQVLEFRKRGHKDYIKMYNKNMELKYHSIDFNNEYVKNDKYIIRFESTLKNSKSFKDAGIKSNSFDSLFSLTENQLIKVVINQLNKHINIKGDIVEILKENEDNIKKLKSEKMRITEFDRYVINVSTLMVKKLNSSYTDVLLYFTNDIESRKLGKKEKHDKLARVKKIYNVVFEDTKQAKDNNVLFDFLSILKT